MEAAQIKVEPGEIEGYALISGKADELKKIFKAMSRLGEGIIFVRSNNMLRIGTGNVYRYIATLDTESTGLDFKAVVKADELIDALGSFKHAIVDLLLSPDGKALIITDWSDTKTVTTWSPSVNYVIEELADVIEKIHTLDVSKHVKVEVYNNMLTTFIRNVEKIETIGHDCYVYIETEGKNALGRVVCEDLEMNYKLYRADENSVEKEAYTGSKNCMNNLGDILRLADDKVTLYVKTETFMAFRFKHYYGDVSIYVVPKTE